MRHHKHGRILSRRAEHRKAMLANLASSLILHGRVKTTDAKAKEVRPFVERMVTFARRGDLHARRIVLARLRDAEAVKKLFAEIGPKFTERAGGYTRIVKLGFRPGDNSPVSLIEFVSDDEKKAKRKKKAPAKPRAAKAAKTTAKAEEAAVEEAPVEETAEETVETAPAEAPAEEAPAEDVTAEAAEPAEEAAPVAEAEEPAAETKAEEAPAEEEADGKAEA